MNRGAAAEALAAEYLVRAGWRSSHATIAAAAEKST